MLPVLDLFDIRLLDALQREGRLGNQQLAEIVHLSPSQCSRRRVTLEEVGIIKRYRAELDSRRLGFSVTAMIQVTLATHSPNNAKEFKALIGRLPAVQEAFSVTGDSDYVLKVVVTDLDALSSLISDELLPHRSVDHVRSSVVLEILKSGNDLPLPDHFSGMPAQAKRRNQSGDNE